MECMEVYLAGGMTLFVNGKHYLDRLEHNDSLTATRNLILEIMMSAPKN